ncbi:MAG: FAD/NAD(P)-binding protein [Gemmatimonadaceae bacterium]
MQTFEPRVHTVAVIGAGFTGAMVAVNLLRMAKVPTRILLVERYGRFSAGVAYGTSFDEHLLNVPAGRMSAFPDDGENFQRWAQERDATISGGAFVPRRLYGAYLADQLDRAESANPDSRLVRLTAEARNVTREGASRWNIELSNGAVNAADAVVLSIGNYEPANPPVADPRFYETARYARDPWATGALDVPATAPVLLLGTGLTMLDIAIALRTRGHSGPIHALSRRGLLPQPHRESAGAPPAHARPTDLATWPRTASGLLRALRREVTLAECNGVDWREVVTSIRHCTSTLWQTLSVEERRRFLRHLRSYWETHRHRSAPATAARIDAMQSSGQLKVHKARVVAYQQQGDLVDVVVQPRAATDAQTLSVARVINCTGPDSNIARVRDPLVQNLLAQHLIRPDALGLGLDTDASGTLLNADGALNENLLLVGPLRKGQLWENTAVPELRVEASQMAAQLAQLGVTTIAGTPVLA